MRGMPFFLLELCDNFWIPDPGKRIMNRCKSTLRKVDPQDQLFKMDEAGAII